MPKVDDEHKETRKMQILKAAFECFGTKGFHKTSMRDICEQAELSSGAVYNYFEGKEQIIEAIAEKSRNSTQFLFEDIQKSDSREKALQKILRNLSDVLLEQQKRGQLKIKIRLWSEAQESGKISDILRENYADIENKIKHCLEEHELNENKETELSIEESARIIIATYQGLLLQMTLRENIDPLNSLGYLSYLFTNHN